MKVVNVNASTELKKYFSDVADHLSSSQSVRAEPTPQRKVNSLHICEIIATEGGKQSTYTLGAVRTKPGSSTSAVTNDAFVNPTDSNKIQSLQTLYQVEEWPQEVETGQCEVENKKSIKQRKKSKIKLKKSCKTKKKDSSINSVKAIIKVNHKKSQSIEDNTNKVLKKLGIRSKSKSTSQANDSDISKYSFVTHPCPEKDSSTLIPLHGISSTDVGSSSKTKHYTSTSDIQVEDSELDQRCYITDSNQFDSQHSDMFSKKSSGDISKNKRRSSLFSPKGGLYSLVGYPQEATLESDDFEKEKTKPEKQEQPTNNQNSEKKDGHPKSLSSASFYASKQHSNLKHIAEISQKNWDRLPNIRTANTCYYEDLDHDIPSTIQFLKSISSKGSGSGCLFNNSCFSSESSDNNFNTSNQTLKNRSEKFGMNCRNSNENGDAHSRNAYCKGETTKDELLTTILNSTSLTSNESDALIMGRSDSSYHDKLNKEAKYMTKDKKTDILEGENVLNSKYNTLLKSENEDTRLPETSKSSPTEFLRKLKEVAFDSQTYLAHCLEELKIRQNDATVTEEEEPKSDSVRTDQESVLERDKRNVRPKTGLNATLSKTKTKQVRCSSGEDSNAVSNLLDVSDDSNSKMINIDEETSIEFPTEGGNQVQTNDKTMFDTMAGKVSISKECIVSELDSTVKDDNESDSESCNESSESFGDWMPRLRKQYRGIKEAISAQEKSGKCKNPVTDSPSDTYETCPIEQISDCESDGLQDTLDEVSHFGKDHQQDTVESEEDFRSIATYSSSETKVVKEKEHMDIKVNMLLNQTAQLIQRKKKEANNERKYLKTATSPKRESSPTSIQKKPSFKSNYKSVKTSHGMALTYNTSATVVSPTPAVTGSVYSNTSAVSALKSSRPSLSRIESLAQPKKRHLLAVKEAHANVLDKKILDRIDKFIENVKQKSSERGGRSSAVDRQKAKPWTSAPSSPRRLVPLMERNSSKTAHFSEKEQSITSKHIRFPLIDRREVFNQTVDISRSAFPPIRESSGEVSSRRSSSMESQVFAPSTPLEPKIFSSLEKVGVLSAERRHGSNTEDARKTRDPVFHNLKIETDSSEHSSNRPLRSTHFLVNTVKANPKSVGIANCSGQLLKKDGQPLYSAGSVPASESSLLCSGSLPSISSVSKDAASGTAQRRSDKASSESAISNISSPLLLSSTSENHGDVRERPGSQSCHRSSTLFSDIGSLENLCSGLSEPSSAFLLNDRSHLSESKASLGQGDTSDQSAVEKNTSIIHKSRISSQVQRSMEIVTKRSINFAEICTTQCKSTSINIIERKRKHRKRISLSLGSLNNSEEDIASSNQDLAEKFRLPLVESEELSENFSEVEFYSSQEKLAAPTMKSNEISELEREQIEKPGSHPFPQMENVSKCSTEEESNPKTSNGSKSNAKKNNSKEEIVNQSESLVASPSELFECLNSKNSSSLLNRLATSALRSDIANYLSILFESINAIEENAEKNIENTNKYITEESTSTQRSSGCIPTNSLLSTSLQISQNPTNLSESEQKSENSSSNSKHYKVAEMSTHHNPIGRSLDLNEPVENSSNVSGTPSTDGQGKPERICKHEYIKENLTMLNDSSAEQAVISDTERKLLDVESNKTQKVESDWIEYVKNKIIEKSDTLQATDTSDQLQNDKARVNNLTKYFSRISEPVNNSGNDSRTHDQENSPPVASVSNVKTVSAGNNFENQSSNSLFANFESMIAVGLTGEQRTNSEQSGNDELDTKVHTDSIVDLLKQLAIDLNESDKTADERLPEIDFGGDTSKCNYLKNTKSNAYNMDQMKSELCTYRCFENLESFVSDSDSENTNTVNGASVNCLYALQKSAAKDSDDSFSSGEIDAFLGDPKEPDAIKSEIKEETSTSTNATLSTSSSSNTESKNYDILQPSNALYSYLTQRYGTNSSDSSKSSDTADTLDWSDMDVGSFDGVFPAVLNRLGARQSSESDVVMHDLVSDELFNDVLKAFSHEEAKGLPSAFEEHLVGFFVNNEQRQDAFKEILDYDNLGYTLHSNENICIANFVVDTEDRHRRHLEPSDNLESSMITNSGSITHACNAVSDVSTLPQETSQINSSNYCNFKELTESEIISEYQNGLSATSLEARRGSELSSPGSDQLRDILPLPPDIDLRLLISLLAIHALPSSSVGSPALLALLQNAAFNQLSEYDDKEVSSVCTSIGSEDISDFGTGACDEYRNVLTLVALRYPGFLFLTCVVFAYFMYFTVVFIHSL